MRLGHIGHLGNLGTVHLSYLLRPHPKNLSRLPVVQSAGNPSPATTCSGQHVAFSFSARLQAGQRLLGHNGTVGALQCQADVDYRMSIKARIRLLGGFQMEDTDMIRCSMQNAPKGPRAHTMSPPLRGWQSLWCGTSSRNGLAIDRLALLCYNIS